MAYLYRRKNSRFIWIGYRDPDTGRTMQESTRCRVGVGPEERRAQEICDVLTAKENSAPQSKFSHEFWDAWVPDMLKAKHNESPNTLKSYQGMWKLLSRFLHEKQIPTARHLTRDHCFSYVIWRRQQGHLNTAKKHPVSTNRILLELKVLSKIVNEAVVRGYCAHNPCHKLGIKRQPPREKAQMSDWHIETIYREIETLKAGARNQEELALYDAYNVAFTIARHQGCRLSETHFPLSAVNFAEMELTLLTKGREYYTTVLCPALVPFLQKLIAEGRVWTFQKPNLWSLKWFNFFDRIRKRYPGKFDDISFHSTRVTVVSRLEEAGAPEIAVMRLVKHASTTVHRNHYRKTTKKELAGYWAALSTGNARPESSDAAHASPAHSPASSSVRDPAENPPGASSPRTTSTTSSSGQAR